MLREKEIQPEPPSQTLPLKKLSIAAALLVSWLMERTGDSRKESTNPEEQETSTIEAAEQAKRMYENS